MSTVNQKMFYEDYFETTWTGERRRIREETVGSCQICKGVGRICGHFPEGHPQAGQLDPTRHDQCECEKEVESLYQEYLSDFKANYPKYHRNNPIPYHLKERASKLADVFKETGRFPEGKRGLLLYGDYRKGKTHLAVSLAKYLAKTRGIQVIFWDTSVLVARLWDREVVQKISASRDIENCQTIGLLVLDDFLSDGNGFSFKTEKLGTILDSRYNDSDSIDEFYVPYDKYTIITTNLPLEELRKSVGERLWHRMEEAFALAKVV